MGRHEASPRLRNQVRTRFSKECAACEAKGDVIDVAHLYEDAALRRPSEDRLILLCPACNQAQDRGKHRRKGQYLNHPSAPSVALLSTRRFWQGNYAGAYQSARLAAYLYSQTADHSMHAEYLTHALSSLRPMRWGDLMRSVLFAFEALCLEQRIDLVPRWLFLDRLALALYDFGKWSLSAQVLRASIQLRSQLGSDQRDQNRLTRDLMSSFRREAMISAFSGMSSRTSMRTLVKRLTDDAGAFLRLEDPDGFATNLDVAAKVLTELVRDDERALVLGEQAFVERERISHRWVIQEHHWRLAEIYSRKGSRRDEQRHVVAALREFHQTPIVLEPVLSTRGPIEHDPIRDLKSRGFSEALLMELEVAPSRHAPRPIPLLLRTNTIERIVRTVLKGT